MLKKEWTPPEIQEEENRLADSFFSQFRGDEEIDTFTELEKYFRSHGSPKLIEWLNNQ